MCAKTVIIIAGPTATGKTALSLEIARYFQTAIISADSRQCFRELNIGVAKPDAAELLSVKHAFINSHSIHEEVNAALFEQLALQRADEIFLEKDELVLVGGTGLYIKAFCEGLDAIPPADEQRRIEIQQEYNRNGLSWLQGQIGIHDPLYFEKGEMQNPYRMMRALEVVESTGRSILSFHQSAKKTRPFRICFFGLQVPRETLYRRINERVDRMMDAGLLEEARSLIPFRHLNALQTVGYTELFEYLDGRSDLPDSISLIKQHTRHYAKRQMTWFKKNKSIQWLENNSLTGFLEFYRRG